MGSLARTARFRIAHSSPIRTRLKPCSAIADLASSRTSKPPRNLPVVQLDEDPFAVHLDGGEPVLPLLGEGCEGNLHPGLFLPVRRWLEPGEGPQSPDFSQSRHAHKFGDEPREVGMNCLGMDLEFALSIRWYGSGSAKLLVLIEENGVGTAPFERLEAAYDLFKGLVHGEAINDVKIIRLDD